MATKQELIQAYCNATEYDAIQHGTVSEYLADQEEFLQKGIDHERERYQTMLDSVPTSAIAKMKQIALDYIAEQQKQQLITDNEAVEL